MLFIQILDENRRVPPSTYIYESDRTSWVLAWLATATEPENDDRQRRIGGGWPFTAVEQGPRLRAAPWVLNSAVPSVREKLDGKRKEESVEE